MGDISLLLSLCDVQFLHNLGGANTFQFNSHSTISVVQFMVDLNPEIQTSAFPLC